MEKFVNDGFDQIQALVASGVLGEELPHREGYARWSILKSNELPAWLRYNSSYKYNNGKEIRWSEE